ncbi:hypothetical protein GDO81_029031 [Engystomops pustulosus]|uniref:Uncharacterized protein n=1 Tax=Engystomops pustulosus TaxID=76066 RepID=A0AAV6ZLS7_ENGPU|nr:hypothetical protein GDO81_029031 [Engystomops pustulosus]
MSSSSPSSSPLPFLPPYANVPSLPLPSHLPYLFLAYLSLSTFPYRSTPLYKYCSERCLKVTCISTLFNGSGSWDRLRLFCLS